VIVDCGLRIADWKQRWVMSPDEFTRSTFDYGIRLVRLVESLSKGDTARELGRQLPRAGMSVGTNYRAAARARSRADFIAKLGIVEEVATILSRVVTLIQTARRQN
jgi:four helix bundle protein